MTRCLDPCDRLAEATCCIQWGKAWAIESCLAKEGMRTKCALHLKWRRAAVVREALRTRPCIVWHSACHTIKRQLVEHGRRSGHTLHPSLLPEKEAAVFSVGSALVAKPKRV